MHKKPSENHSRHAALSVLTLDGPMIMPVHRVRVMSSSSSRPQLTVPSPSPFWPSSSSSNKRKLRGTLTEIKKTISILKSLMTRQLFMQTQKTCYVDFGESCCCQKEHRPPLHLKPNTSADFTLTCISGDPIISGPDVSWDTHTNPEACLRTHTHPEVSLTSGSLILSNVNMRHLCAEVSSSQHKCLSLLFQQSVVSFGLFSNIFVSSP